MSLPPQLDAAGGGAAQFPSPAAPHNPTPYMPLPLPTAAPAAAAPRSRPLRTLACDRCHHRKAKCLRIPTGGDGSSPTTPTSPILDPNQLPPCVRCVQQGKPCVVTGRTFSANYKDQATRGADQFAAASAAGLSATTSASPAALAAISIAPAQGLKRARTAEDDEHFGRGANTVDLARRVGTTDARGASQQKMPEYGPVATAASDGGLYPIPHSVDAPRIPDGSVYGLDPATDGGYPALDDEQQWLDHGDNASKGFVACEPHIYGVDDSLAGEATEWPQDGPDQSWGLDEIDPQLFAMATQETLVAETPSTAIATTPTPTAAVDRSADRLPSCQDLLAALLVDFEKAADTVPTMLASMEKQASAEPEDPPQDHINPTKGLATLLSLAQRLSDAYPEALAVERKQSVSKPNGATKETAESTASAWSSIQNSILPPGTERISLRQHGDAGDPKSPLSGTATLTTLLHTCHSRFLDLLEMVLGAVKRPEDPTTKPSSDTDHVDGEGSASVLSKDLPGAIPDTPATKVEAATKGEEDSTRSPGTPSGATNITLLFQVLESLSGWAARVGEIVEGTNGSPSMNDEASNPGTEQTEGANDNDERATKRRRVADTAPTAVQFAELKARNDATLRNCMGFKTRMQRMFDGQARP